MTTFHIVPFSANLWTQIAADWSTLLEQRRDASVFLSGPWIKTWLAAFGDQLRPEALIWRNEQGECVAACLLTIRRERRGPFTVRRGYLNATGEHQLASEHNLLLCSDHYEERVHADLVRHLRRRADSLMLSGFRSSAVDAVRRAWPTGGSNEGFTSDDRYVSLDKLRAEAKPYLAALSRNTREKIRRSIRLYEEEFGPIAMDVARTSAEALQTFTELRSLHDARWHAQGLTGAFATPESKQFHESLISEHVTAPGDAREFSVNLIRIRYGSAVIGVLYNLVYRGAVSFYQSGFHYTEDNRLKPGLVAHALTIQRYVDEGASEYDFLAGEPETAQYKTSLGTEHRPLLWLEWGVPNPKMWLINRLRSWRARRS